MALSIVTLSANGLRDQSKRAGLLQWFRSLTVVPDILSACKNFIVLLTWNVRLGFGPLRWTKKWIYIKFAQRKGIANISLLQSKPVANVVKSTFATIFARQCKYGSKCGLYYVCYRFALEQRYVCNTFALRKYNVNPFFSPVSWLSLCPSC